MKTSFQRGREQACFIASQPDGVRSCPGTVAETPAAAAAAALTGHPPLWWSSEAQPQTRLTAHCWAAAYSTVGSRAAGAPLHHFGWRRFPGLHNFECWLSLYEEEEAGTRGIRGVLIHTPWLILCMYYLTYLAYLSAAGWRCGLSALPKDVL